MGDVLSFMLFIRPILSNFQKKTLTWAFKNGLIIQREKIDFFPIAAGLLALPHTAKIHA